MNLRARDGYQLGGELWEPAGEAKGAVLIGPAMAVRARFYGRLGEWLAGQGYAALAVDYRGIGQSRNGGLRGFRAEMHEWGEQDLGGALDHLTKRYAPLYFIGHSAGGQLFGLLENAPVQSALFVAAQSGYWKNWGGLGSLAMLGFWQLVVPLSTALAGRLPMRAFGQGDDVPLGVAREWRRWGLRPDYIWSYAGPRGGLGFKSYAGRLRAVAVANDRYAPARSVAELLKLYQTTQKELHIEAAPVGHFGWFQTPSLWPAALAWLAAS